MQQLRFEQNWGDSLIIVSSEMIVSKWEPYFTEKEIKRWYELKWVTLDEAVSLIKNEVANTDEAKPRRERELFIIEKSIEELCNF